MRFVVVGGWGLGLACCFGWGEGFVAVGGGFGSSSSWRRFG